MPAPCSANACSSIGGRLDNDVETEPVHHEASSLAPESGKPVATSTEPACELGHIIGKSIQVRLPTHCEEASEADEKKLLSTIATQTEPQGASLGFLSVTSMEQSSSVT
ncbi:hypothetical protein MRX96_043432, partial [Rhipicephalus microplus]